MRWSGSECASTSQKRDPSTSPGQVVDGFESSYGLEVDFDAEAEDDGRVDIDRLTIQQVGMYFQSLTESEDI